MIRFVDLTPATENTSCAFLDTVTDEFISDEFGGHVFGSDAELDAIYADGDEGLIERCRRLVPEGFWS